jgi:hypothetical protein
MPSIESEELRALVQRIINSGELGRSRTYSEILLYLAECAIEGNNPKEVAIAIDVLGRDPDFDVGKDSIVRVHIYHLRNKLTAYFNKYGKQEKFRLDIPKGQYILTAAPAKEAEAARQTEEKAPNKREAMTFWFAALAIVLLLINLTIQFLGTGEEGSSTSEFAALSPWQEILDDQVPILVLVGDYYIFGEVNAQGDVTRLVREFDVNSPEELRFLQDVGVAGSEVYYDLGLNYIPSSSAYALTQLLTGPMQGISPGRISIKLVSDYSTADLANNHIIYLGYLSGLQELYALMFAGSNLAIGATFDELSNMETGDYYVSNSGLSGGDSYKDYSMLASFPSPNGHQISMIAGMRDESLINIAQQVSNPDVLTEIEQALQQGPAPGSHFEALFEVFGFDNTNFNSRLIYIHNRDPQAVAGFFGGN